ncbi:hypothetical protein AWB81_07573 [Caballeronia arationis]|jgi:hypothetical protein|uniref:hypothetical protein n=1 Tax=Caballeronia arationis TaxID=1777142 RepID=UPI00074CA5FD|nr:hypothetical protein [Caballeronia arationis]SAL06404.1 hypothetical protein AWB81_07573 [Caballeronia arationis]
MTTYDEINDILNEIEIMTTEIREGFVEMNASIDRIEDEIAATSATLKRIDKLVTDRLARNTP